MTKKLPKLKNAIKYSFVTLIIIGFIYGCGGTKWMSSPAKDVYKQSRALLKEGKAIEAMALATKAVTVDPIQLKPKELINKNFNEILQNTLAELKKTEGTKDVAAAERRYLLYVNLDKIYKNLSKVQLPFEHPKGKWSWTTEIADYSNQVTESRDYAYDVIYTHASGLLNKNDAKNAYTFYKLANSKYTLKGSEKRTKSTDDIYSDLFKHAQQNEKSGDLYKTADSNYSYFYANEFKPTTEAKEGIKRTKILVSDLWVKEGKKLEAKKDLTSLLEANKAYTNALTWNKENKEAPVCQTAVKEKIAENYYQQGIALQKAKSKDYAKLKSIYAEAEKWVPDYKDVKKRLYAFSVLEEVISLRTNLETTSNEQAKFQESVNSVCKNVDATNDMLNKLTYITDKVREYNQTIKSITKTLGYLSPIPVVGTVAGVVKNSLNIVRTPIQKIVTYANTVEKPVIIPTKNGVTKIKLGTDGVKGKMLTTGIIINNTRKTAGLLEECIFNMEKEEDYKECAFAIDKINKTLPVLNKQMHSVNKGMSTANGAVIKVYNLIAQPVTTVESAIRQLDPAMKEVKKGVNEVEKILNKNIKGISVKDVLNAVSYPAQLLLGQVEKLLAPAFKSMQSALPQIPGVDAMTTAIDQVKTIYQDVIDKSNSLYGEYEKYSNYERIISDNLSTIVEKTGCGVNYKNYLVQSAQEYGKSQKGFWDIPGSDVLFTKGQNLKVWDIGNEHKVGDRLFRFKNIGNGWFEIIPAYTYEAGCVDISGNEQKNGANLHIWEEYKGNAQKFKIKPTKDGRYKIYNINGKIICLDGRKSDNGSNVCMWADHAGLFTEWVFIDPVTKKVVKPF